MDRTAWVLLLILFIPFMASDRPAKKRPPTAIKAALCQIFCLDGDRAGNLVRIENALREAKAGGADLACFPETAILGWVNPAAHERAHPIPGKDTERLCALAKKYGLWICCGLAEKEEDRLYDAAVLINSEGTIALRHRKINVLTELMAPAYTAGRGMETAETPFGRVGLLICADSFKEELLEKMAALKPDLVLIPYGWAAPEEKWPDHGKSLQNTVSAAARVMGAPVIGTDLVGAITNGPWQGFVYGGQSVVADRAGKCIMTCRDRDREVKILELALARDQ